MSSARGSEPSNAAAEKSAVDANVRASHVTARAPACQEYARADQIARLAEFGHRRMLQYRLRALGRRPIVIEKKCSVLSRRKKPGRDRIDAYAASGPLARQESGQAQHRGFGRRVRHHSRQRNVRRHAGQVDDAARTARRHRAAELLAWKESSTNNIKVEVGAPIVLVDMLERGVSSHRHASTIATGGVHQNCGRAERIFNKLMSATQAGSIARIDRVKFRDAASLANRRDA